MSSNSGIDVKLLLIEQQKSIDYDEKRYLGRNSKLNAQAKDNEKTILRSNQFNIQSLFGLNNIYRLRSELYPGANFKREYIVLDTVNRIPDDKTQNLKWNYVSTNVYQPTAVATKSPVRDLVGMRIYPIHLHGNLGNSGRYRWTFTILIEEFEEQAFIAHQSRRFHFMMRYTNIVPPDLTPVNDGFFWFNHPITTIDTLTVTIANPLVDVNLLSSVSPYNNSSVVTVTTTTIEVRLGFNPNFTIGNRFNFDNWSTTDPTADSEAIRIINDYGGHVLLSGTSTLLFAISPSIPPLVGALDGKMFLIYNESLRLVIPLELIFIDPNTNEIDT